MEQSPWLVGAEGFEPSNTGSKDPRLTAWPRPKTSRRPEPRARSTFETSCPRGAGQADSAHPRGEAHDVRGGASHARPERASRNTLAYTTPPRLGKSGPQPLGIFGARQRPRADDLPAGPRQVGGRPPGGIQTVEQAETGGPRT